jgi:hypothetical protein
MSNNYVGTSMLSRLQIPGLYINDEQVDGEIYIQWTPSASSTRLQTSTVLIVAGPNARRPGLYPHDGLSNPQIQELTETQAEAFVPREQGATTKDFLNRACEKEDPIKQYKKPGPKLGYKRKKTMAFTSAGHNDGPLPAVTLNKRHKTVNENEKSGDESIMLPTSTSPEVPKLGVIPTLAATPTNVLLTNSENTESVNDRQNGINEVPVEVSTKAARRSLAKRLAKLSSEELESAKKSEKAVGKKPMTRPQTNKITVDGMGRKRTRDSRGRYNQYTLTFRSANRFIRILHKRLGGQCYSKASGQLIG